MFGISSFSNPMLDYSSEFILNAGIVDGPWIASAELGFLVVAAILS